MTRNAFNPDLLNLARRSAGLSQSALHRKTKISQSFLSKIERGETVPSATNIQKLAEALDFPVNFFFQDIALPGGPVSFEAHFRKKASVKDTAVDRLKAQMQVYLLALGKMLTTSGSNTTFSLPEFSPENVTPEQAARNIRAHWNCESGPLPDLATLIEENGGIIIPFQPLADIGAEGVTIFGDRGEVYIFINPTSYADRQRFTLAHELGHALLHRIPTLEMEKQADRFASELLMPEEDIHALFENKAIGLDVLAQHKPVWRVSIQSLLYRVKALGIISPSHSTMLWQQISAMRWRLREPARFDFVGDKPTKFRSVCRAALARFDNNIETLANHLCLPKSEVSKMTAS